MAIFNPDVGDVPSASMPDQTGASRGVTPNRAFEAIFEGAGNALKGAVGLADEFIQSNIDYEVREGNNAALKPITDTVPAEMQGGISALQTLQTAYDQGKISDVYFYGQLTALSKSLRAKYPGYEDVVDTTIQNVTGVRPANAYRDAIINEYQTMATNAKNEENKWDQWVKENEKIIGTIYPDYFIDPSKYDRDQVRKAVVDKKARDYTIDSQNAEIQLMVNQDNLNEERATEVATTSLGQTVNTFMVGTNNALGFNGSDVVKKITEAQATGFTTDEYAQIVQQYGQAETALRYNLMQQINTPLVEGSVDTYASVLGSKAANDLVEQAMAPFLAVKQLITDQNYGMAAFYQNLNTMRGQESLARVLDASPDLQAAMALKEVSQQLADIYLTESGRQEGIFNSIVPEMAARNVFGQDTFAGQVDRVVNSTEGSQDKSSALNAMIDSNLAGLASGQLTPDQVANFVDGAYGQMQDGKSIFTYINPNERQTLYLRMFNPSVTKAIIASGDRKSLSTYYEAARAEVAGIPEFRKAAASMQGVADWQRNFDVSFNPTTGSVQLNVLDTAGALGDLSNPFNAGFTQASIKSAQEGITALNNVFSMLNPMLEGLGVDEQMKPAIYQQVMKELNIELDGGKKDTFFDWLGKELSGVLNQLDDGVDPDTPMKEAMMGFTFNESTGDDFGLIADTIMGFEGYSNKAYWDVNANRAGYGSDTITDANGNVSQVTPDTVVDKEGAARDLSRRLLNEFIPGIIADVGSDNWRGLSERTRAALASIAYNYGSLPRSVVKAVKTGDQETIALAIEALQTHNEGVNKKRRLKEAELVRSS